MLTRALKNHPAVAALISELEQARLERDEAKVRFESNLNQINFDILWELDHVTQERDQYLVERDAAVNYYQGLEVELDHEFRVQMLYEEIEELEERKRVLKDELETEKATGFEYKSRQLVDNDKMVISLPTKYSPLNLSENDYAECVQLMEEKIVNMLNNTNRSNRENEILREEVNSLREQQQQQQPDEENMSLRCVVCFNDVNVRGTGFSVSDCRHALCTICSLRCNVCPICREKTDYTKIIFN